MPRTYTLTPPAHGLSEEEDLAAKAIEADAVPLLLEALRHNLKESDLGDNAKACANALYAIASLASDNEEVQVRYLMCMD